jgi:hypothetical protein
MNELSNPVRPKLNPRSPLHALFAGQKFWKKIQKNLKKIQSGRRDAVGGGFVTRTLAQGWCGGAWSG